MKNIIYEPAASEERRELLAWLKLNARHFSEDYTADEIAYFAIMNGFSRSLIYKEIPHWFMDQKQHCGFDARMDFHVGRELRYITPLQEQWERLVRYQIGLE